MVEQLKNELIDRWPLLTLVLLLSGGGSSLGNFLTGSSGEISTLTEEFRELKYTVQSAWSVSMEMSAWDRAGRELRKNYPDWVGPDVIEIKKLHSGRE